MSANRPASKRARPGSGDAAIVALLFVLALGLGGGAAVMLDGHLERAAEHSALQADLAAERSITREQERRVARLAERVARKEAEARARE